MNKNPVIIVPAIGQSKLYLTDGNGNKIKNVWPFELDEKALLEEMKGSLMKMMLFRTDGGFSDKVASIVNELTEPFACDSTGKPKHSIKTALSSACYAECNEKEQEFIKSVCPAVDGLAGRLGADKVFYFAYNFLGDVEETAASLDVLVDNVIAKTGSEKVDFIIFGTGAAVLKAYLKNYSVKSCVRNVVFVAAFLDGASIVRDIYENRLHIENPAELLSALGGKAASLASVVGMLPPDVVQNVITKSMNVLKKNILDNCTSLRALIPSESFAETVKMLEENGMKFSFVCGRGKSLPSVFGSAGVDSDGIVDVSSASLGGAFEGSTLFIDGVEHFNIMKNKATVEFVVNTLSEEK